MLPEPEGVHFRGNAPESGTRVARYLLPVPSGATLTQMLDDWVFYTPASLYLFGGMHDAPLSDFLHAHPDFCLYMRLFNRPMFIGLTQPDGDASWNRGLWACEKSYWSALSDFFASMMLVDPGRVLVNVGQQELKVYDPLSEVPTLLPVTAFCAMRPNGTYAFANSIPPRLQKTEPDIAVMAMANRYRRDDNPKPIGG